MGPSVFLLESQIRPLDLITNEFLLRNLATLRDFATRAFVELNLNPMESMRTNGIKKTIHEWHKCPGIPTTIKTKGVNITTIVYLRVLIIQTGSTIILMVVEAQGMYGKCREIYHTWIRIESETMFNCWFISQYMVYISTFISETTQV